MRAIIAFPFFIAAYALAALGFVMFMLAIFMGVCCGRIAYRRTRWPHRGKLEA